MNNKGYMDTWTGGTPTGKRCGHMGKDGKQSVIENGTRTSECRDCGMPMVFLFPEWREAPQLKRGPAVGNQGLLKHAAAYSEAQPLPSSKPVAIQVESKETLKTSEPIDVRIKKILKYSGSDANKADPEAVKSLREFLEKEDARKAKRRSGGNP